jgi:ribosomal protein S18 acetylase RimI-like enzyme
MDRTIVRLGSDRAEAATATLAAAFHDDPAMCYLFPDEPRRAPRLTRLMRWMVDDHLKHGIVLGTPAAEAVTLWRPPGGVHRHDPLWHPGTLRFIPIFGRHILRAIATDDGIREHLPQGEHWMYLKMAAVRPDMQGQGLGGAAIRAGIAQGAERSVPAVLETATPSNVGLYRSLGFGVVAEWDVPRGGPHFWTMQRPLAELEPAARRGAVPA